ncbi:hypothetical protein [Longimicrobium sp.]|uniref:hypothetical protein n=1 Tax=Longimicrobium sp. TaxID=2029185 RepID=UPI003B3B9F9F
MTASMRDFAERTYRTRRHLLKLIERLNETAIRESSKFLVLSGSTDEWLMFDVSGVRIVFRAAYGLDGTGYLECGHHEMDERQEARFLTDLSLEIDPLGNVDHRWTISEVGSNLEALLDRTYDRILERFAGRQVRIVNGVFDPRS